MAGGMLEPVGKKNIQKLIDGLRWALTMPAAQAVVEAPPQVMETPSAAVETAAFQPGDWRRFAGRGFSSGGGAATE